MWKPLAILLLIIVSAVATAAVIFQSVNRDETVYTDGATIRRSVDEAPVRSVLWTPPVALPEPINTSGADEYEPREYGGGLSLLFVRGRAGENADIWRSDWTGDHWDDPQPFDELNSESDDLGPSPTRDGSAIYFYSDREGGHGGYDLWIVRRAETGEWSAPENLGPAVNSSHHEYGPAPTPDGASLYFASNRPRSDEPVTGSREHWPATIRENRDRRDYDLFVAAVNGRGIGDARRLDALNSTHDEGAPAVSPIGDFLYFASDRPGGRGGFDLYRARRQSNGHGPVEQLGEPVNTEANELDPALRHLGFELLFSSDRLATDTAEDEATEAKYDLFVSESHEVYRDSEPARSSLDWSAIIPWLWLLALLALLLLFLLLLRRFAQGDVWRDRWRKLSLLAKCVILSLFAHALLMLLLAAWQVSPALLDVFDRDGGGTKVALVAPANMAIVSQLHGTLEIPAVEAPTPSAEAPPEPLTNDAIMPPAELAVESQASRPTAPSDTTLVEEAVPDRASWATPDMTEEFSPAPPPVAATTPSDSVRNETATEERMTLSPGQPTPRAPAPVLRDSVADTPVELPPTNEFAHAPFADPTPFVPPTPSPSVGAPSFEDAVSLPDSLIEAVSAPSLSAPAESLPRSVDAEPSLAEAARVALPQSTAAMSAPPKGELEFLEPSNPTVDAPIETTQPAIPRPGPMSSPPVSATPSRDRSSEYEAGPIPDSDTSQASLGSLALPDETPDLDIAATDEAPSRDVGRESVPPLRRDASSIRSELTDPTSRESIDAFELPLESNPTVDPWSSPVDPTRVARRAIEPATLEPLDNNVSELDLATPSTPSEEAPFSELSETARSGDSRSSMQDQWAPLRVAPPMLLEVTPDEIMDAAPAVPSEPSLLADRSPREASPMQEMIDAAASRRSSLDFATAATPAFPGRSLTPDVAIPMDQAPAADAYAQRDPEVRDDLVVEGGGGEETERAVAMALDWLGRHQSRDGKWSGRSFDDDCGRCGGQAGFDFDRALTGLSLLCFLGANHTHEFEGPYRETVERGLRWLVNAQGPDGDLRQGETMYSHGIATIALCEAYGMTGDIDLREPAQRAVDFIVRARHRPSGAWRYDPGQFGDTSVLGWQIMALVSARRAGLEVPDEALERAHAWLDQVSHPRAPGRYAYQPGIPPSPSMTAEGLFVRQLLGDDSTMERGRDSVAFIEEHPPRWEEDANTYYWYYATLALYQHGGESWETWNEAVVSELLDHQHQDGRLTGSWSPADQWSTIGGRVYQTALCALSLEVYYRYLPQYLRPTGADD